MPFQMIMMKPFVLCSLFLTILTGTVLAQPVAKNIPTWSETDRQFLIDNLTRSLHEIREETKNLSREQWNFRESPDRWNINQIVEHIALWELLFMREVSAALSMPPDSAFAHPAPDSVFLNSPNNPQKNNALEYTRPFSFAVPLGNNELKNNVTWLATMRNESIEFLKKENRNIRLQFDYCTGINVHQYFLMIFGHTDRHLRQLRQVKTHAQYPKK